MKNIFLILISLLLFDSLQAQPPLGERIPEKMNLFIQKRMRMTGGEREAFGPVFLLAIKKSGEKPCEKIAKTDY